MIGRIVTLLAQFPFEGLRLRNWRANVPHTFGSSVTVSSTFAPKTDTLTCKVYGHGCAKANTVVIDANNSRWDYLHPTRKPAFVAVKSATGHHLTVSIPSGYRLAHVQFHHAPECLNLIRVQMIARDFFGREITHEEVIRTRGIDDPAPEDMV